MNCTEITCPYNHSRNICAGICLSIFISTAFSLCVFLQCTLRKTASTSQMVIKGIAWNISHKIFVFIIIMIILDWAVDLFKCPT